MDSTYRSLLSLVANAGRCDELNAEHLPRHMMSMSSSSVQKAWQKCFWTRYAPDASIVTLILLILASLCRAHVEFDTSHSTRTRAQNRHSNVHLTGTSVSAPSQPSLVWRLGQSGSLMQPKSFLPWKKLLLRYSENCPWARGPGFLDLPSGCNTSGDSHEGLLLLSAII